MSDNYGARCKSCDIGQPACCGLCTVCVSKLEQQLAELRGAVKNDMERRIARLESAIHQYMQTTDQRGTKQRLIENFVGMYEYTTKEERDKEDASKG